MLRHYNYIVWPTSRLRPDFLKTITQFFPRFKFFMIGFWDASVVTGEPSVTISRTPVNWTRIGDVVSEKKETFYLIGLFSFRSIRYQFGERI